VDLPLPHGSESLP
jgi:hypothetical protein